MRGYNHNCLLLLVIACNLTESNLRYKNFEKLKSIEIEMSNFKSISTILILFMLSLFIVSCGGGSSGSGGTGGSSPSPSTGDGDGPGNGDGNGDNGNGDGDGDGDGDPNPMPDPEPIMFNPDLRESGVLKSFAASTDDRGVEIFINNESESRPGRYLTIKSIGVNGYGEIGFYPLYELFGTPADQRSEFTV